MWFRSLYILKIEQPFTYNAEDLQNLLQNNELTHIPPGQREAIGWISPFGSQSNQLLLANQGHFLIGMGKQERLLPASVIKDHVQQRIEEIEARDDRKITGREKRELREDVEFELLPKAFTKRSHLDAWIDSNRGWLVINTSSVNKADAMAGLLRNSLSGFSLVLPEAESSPYAKMTQWLKNNRPPRPFEFGYECLFKSADEQTSTVTFKKHALQGDELTSNLAAGKIVAHLELTWDEKIRLVMTDNLIIKRLRFLDIMRDDLDQQGIETSEDKLDAEFALMIGEVTHMLNELLEPLGITYGTVGK